MLTFEKIKNYYNNGFWTKKMVGDAVRMKKISAEEYKEITGEIYEEVAAEAVVEENKEVIAEEENVAN